MTHTEALQFTIGDDTVSVWHDGGDVDHDFGQYRQRYGYRIETVAWEYVGNDIRSGCSSAVDVAEAARTLFSFLDACAEARDYQDRYGISENADIFPEHVGQWAEANQDEISLLSMESEES